MMIAPLAPGRRRRSAFTLLEVLLATAIGVMLLAALYVAVDVQLTVMHRGTRSIEQGALARGLFHKMAGDISGCIAGPLPPVTTSSSGGSAAGGSATGGSGAGGSAAGATGAAATTTTSTDAVTFNIGVLGDSTDLILSNIRPPRENLNPGTLSSGGQVIGVSDLRHAIWWMTDTGLARYEMRAVTSSDAATMLTLPPVISDEKSWVIAPEVKSLQFQYFDGANWQDSWDSTQPSSLPNSDGVTPQGPPVAIAVVMGIQQDNLGKDSGDVDADNVKSYRRVIVIPAANGTVIQPSLNTPAGGSGTGGATGQ
jgi:prepilin-type N-terminal cleavage/methylation domain-containing protein